MIVYFFFELLVRYNFLLIFVIIMIIINYNSLYFRVMIKFYWFISISLEFLYYFFG